MLPLLQIEPELFSAFADYLKPENTLTWRLWKRDAAEAGSEALAKDKKAGVDGLEEAVAEVAALGESSVLAKGGEGTRRLLKKERWCVHVLP